jgi:hypothetical protein
MFAAACVVGCGGVEVTGTIDGGVGRMFNSAISGTASGGAGGFAAGTGGSGDGTTDRAGRSRCARDKVRNPGGVRITSAGGRSRDSKGVRCDWTVLRSGGGIGIGEIASTAGEAGCKFGDTTIVSERESAS